MDGLYTNQNPFRKIRGIQFSETLMDKRIIESGSNEQN